MHQTNYLLLSCCYDGSLDTRMQFAEQLYINRFDYLSKNAELQKSLSLLREYGQVLSRHMQNMKMDLLCKKCASHPQGGCCSAEMATNCDAILLLMNKLLGLTLSQQREDPSSCCFLGPHGCIFLVKPIFCLNYNCSHILSALTSVMMDKVYILVGQMLNQQNQVENLLINLLFYQKNRG